MDDELFDLVYRIVAELSPRREKRVQFACRTIVLLYLWSVIRNKPRYWACDPRNAPCRLSDTPLPSPSQFSRRLRGDAAQRLLEAVERRVREIEWAALVGFWLIDAKPLLVSPYSKDKQARRGWAYDGFARG